MAHKEAMLYTNQDLDEIDRNARAYGFEIGRGQALAERIESSEDNPFLDPNWRDLIKENAGDRESL